MKTSLTLLLCAATLFLLSCSEETVDVKPSGKTIISIGALENIKSSNANARMGGPQNSQPVYHFSDPGTPIQGSSSGINRGPNGISMNFNVRGVIPGNAYTVWYVIFNEPGNCTGTPCAEADIFNPDTQTDVTFGGGNVAGNGNLTISGHRSVGDLSGSAIPFFNQVLGINLPVVGLIDPQGAEVHLVLRCHGPMVPANMPDQIDSFEGGCTAFLDAGEVTDDVGECADTHFSIHLPG